MFVRLTSRRSGNVLAFALMGLVALLAIALVLFSRARREVVVDPANPTATDPETVTTPAATSTGEDAAFELTPPEADDVTTVTVPEAPVEVQLPPPPPPISTPDNRDLPPEG